MAKYKVLEVSFINNTIVKVGEIVEYDGKPGVNLEPVGKEKKESAEPADAPAQ
jgi:hypothetical protein